MAITAWSAKVWSRAICLSENGSTSVRRIPMAPIARHREAAAHSHRPITDSLCQIASDRIVSRFNEILDLDDS